MTLLHLPEHELEIDVSGLSARLRAEPLPLSPLSVRLLVLLAENHGRVVTPAELRRTVWKGVHVGDAAIYQAVRTLRAELGGASRVIRNERGIGYCLIANMVETRPAESGSRPHLVGRESALETFRRSFDAALDGRPSALVVFGEAGIGKTRLLEEIVARARRRGARVGFAGCPVLEPARPLDPWRDVIAQIGLDELTGRLPPAHAAEVRRIFADDGGAASSPSGSRVAPGERDRLFDLLGLAIAGLGRDTPLMIVVDDLHHADQISLRLLEWLAARATSTRLLLVVAIRRNADALPRLLALPTVEPISLDRLGVADVSAIASAALGAQLAPGQAERLHARSGGNPFLLQALLRQGTGGDPLESADFSDLLRASILRLLAGVPPTSVTVLRDGAVLGSTFSERTLREISDASPEAIASAVGHGISAGLLVGSTPGERIRFAHDLLQEGLYDDIPREERAARHARVVGALSQTPSPGAAVLIRIADHAWSAQGALDDSIVASACIAAAEAAHDALAYETAARQLERAIALTREPVQRAELLIAQAEAHGYAGEAKEARAASREAIDLARSLGAADLLARAVLTLAKVRGQDIESGGGRWIEDLEHALAASPSDDALRARLLAALAQATWPREPPGRPEALARESVEVARRSRDAETLAFALVRAYRIDVPDSRDFASRRSCVRELAELDGRISDRVLAQESRQIRLLHAFAEGDRAAVDAIVSDATKEAEAASRPHVEYLANAIRASYEHMIGRFDEAESWALRAFELGRSLRLVHARHQYVLQVVPIQRDRGTLGRLVETVREVARDSTMQIGWTIAWRWCEVHSGRTEAARELLRWLVAERLEPLGPNFNVGSMLAMLADIAVLLEEEEVAATLYESIAPMRETHATAGLGFCHWGSLARVLGTLATLQGELTVAEVDFEEGLMRDRRLGALPFVARGSVEYGAMLARRNAPGDVERARRLLEQGRRLALELGINLDGMTPHG